jgi:hypothetical protein
MELQSGTGIDAHGNGHPGKTMPRLKVLSGADPVHTPATAGRVEIVTRAGLAGLKHWARAFSGQRKDHRYYELIERTLCPDFTYRYFVIRDDKGKVRAIQPFFLLDQDLLAGAPSLSRAADRLVRGLWPNFLRLRTLMVGCAAGEGHLDLGNGGSRSLHLGLFAEALRKHAVEAGARLIVMKEFPAQYRARLDCFLDHGFARIPSFPMASLDLPYTGFEDYLRRAVDARMRSELRRKFRATDRCAPIEMSVTRNIAPVVDEVYPLYLQVYERSPLHFEKLTKAHLCELGRVMPDKVRFFVWRQSGKPVAFSVSMVHGDTIYNEYLGLDYAVALNLHLYFRAFRDIASWAMANGYKRWVSTGLSYKPKLQLRFRLMPLDLYVRHTSPFLNVLLGWLLPLIEPTHRDRTLQKFPNHADLWAGRTKRSACPAPEMKPGYPRASSTARSEIFDQAPTRSRKAR